MRELPGLLDREDIDLPPSMRPRIRELLEELWQRASRIVDLDDGIAGIAGASAGCQRLMAIPGVGPLGATVLGMEPGDACAFRNGRDFAACLGLNPRQALNGRQKPIAGNQQER